MELGFVALVVPASCELSGREVLPRFDTDPVHRTTRFPNAVAARVTGR